MKKVPLGNNVDASVLARGTPGFSGADLANLVNEAALLAARLTKRTVPSDDFEGAKYTIKMGSERKSMVMPEEEKKLTAYHEAGHASVAIHEPESDPIHKATIIPRGRALGLVMRLPVGDRISMSRAKLKADLSVAMGGRIAEEMIFGEEQVTTGASSDIQMATDTARRMVTEWGMSDKLGPLRYAGNPDEAYMGGAKHMSDDTAALVDSETRDIVETAYKRAQQILTDKIDELHTLAKALLEYELLSGDEIKDLLAGKAIIREDADEEPINKVPKSSVPTGGGISSE
jgi:cell division protease FtsH